MFITSDTHVENSTSEKKSQRHRLTGYLGVIIYRMYELRIVLLTVECEKKNADELPAIRPVEPRWVLFQTAKLFQGIFLGVPLKETPRTIHRRKQQDHQSHHKGC
ncbi:hypothetical protein QTP88_008865 [Uroleucon formosanum]